MTITNDLIFAAKRAVEHARLLGHDCRNIVIQQPRGEKAVRVCHQGVSIVWTGGWAVYLGRPTRALAAISAELSYLA